VFAGSAKYSGPKTFSPAEPPVDAPGQPARGGKVKAGTRPAQPVGVGAFTLSNRAVSKSFDGRCSGERIYGRDFKHEIEADIADPFDGAQCTKCAGNLKRTRTIEFGHIFKYDHFYTEKHDGFFTDRDGSKKLMYMGAYGIGIDRAIATIVEKHHDDKGIIWPAQVAPYLVHLIGLDLQDSVIKTKVEKLYHQLLEAGIEVLYDDHEETRAGEKFATADLIGNPIRLVISKRTEDKIEWKKRRETESTLLTDTELLNKLNLLINN